MSIKKMKKEELELMSNKDIAYLLLEENGKMNTADIFHEVILLLELPESTFENKIGDFYTSMTTDKRFVMLEDGCWDLRNHHTSDKVIIKTDDEEELEDIKEEEDEVQGTDEDSYDPTDDEDSYDDTDDGLKDLVVIDENELDQDE